MPKPAEVTGRFITIEGGEGTGKSTQTALLATWLAQRGYPVLHTREPGGAPGAELLRRLLLSGSPQFTPMAETLLHFAARAEHVARSIRPALAAGMWVVCDRFFDSTMAYQGYAQGVDLAAIQTLIAMLGIEPDLTFILEASIDTTMRRLQQRGGTLDRYERLGPAFFAKTAAGFSEIAAHKPRRYCIINADRDVDEISIELQSITARTLALPFQSVPSHC